MHDRRLLGLIEAVQIWHRRIEREERIERQCRRLAIEHQRAVAAQFDPIRVADRRRDREPVKRAPQHDDQDTRIAALGARQPRRVRPGEQCARANQKVPSRR